MENVRPSSSVAPAPAPSHDAAFEYDHQSRKRKASRDDDFQTACTSHALLPSPIPASSPSPAAAPSLSSLSGATSIRDDHARDASMGGICQCDSYASAACVSAPEAPRTPQPRPLHRPPLSPSPTRIHCEPQSSLHDILTTPSCPDNVGDPSPPAADNNSPSSPSPSPADTRQPKRPRIDLSIRTSPPRPSLTTRRTSRHPHLSKRRSHHRRTPRPAPRPIALRLAFAPPPLPALPAPNSTMDLDRDSRPPQTSSAISPVSVPAQLSPPPSPTKQKSATGSAKGSSEGLLVASALHATHPTASSALQGSPPPPQTAVGTSAEKPLALSLKLGASTSDLSFSSNDLPSPSFCPVPPPPPPTPVLCHPYQSLALAALAPPHALPASLSATVSHHTLIQPHIPSLHPLITRETLKELDLEAILRNPQLRHDLLFDPGLQFRPTSGRRKRDATEKYWIAVQREVEEGCTCTCFDDVGHVYECVCATSSCGMRAPVTIRMPSRIPPLIAELLEVLLSVISPAHPPSPSTASAPLPSPNGPAPAPAPVSTAAAAVSTTSSSSSAQTNLAHAALRAALDPVLISQELSHGVLDPASLFRYIGDTLKCHCAPMRDCLVERMVEVASTEGVGKRGAVKALRMCFEILELMKLDIANHQLQALRPYLLETSVDFELKTFHDRYERGLITLHQTRDWLRAAHRRLCESAIARKAPKLRTINLALCEGLVELVFAPPASPTSPPPSPTPSSSSSSSSGSSVSGSGSHRSPLVLPPGYPETLYLDHSRLTSLMTDASDLTALYMLLLLYRQLVFSTASGTKTKARIEDREIDRVKREVWEVGPARLGLCFFKGNGSGSGGHGHHHGKHSTSSSSSSSSSSAGRSAVNAGGAVVVDETVKWRREMKDVVLQVAVRAEEAREGLSASRSTPSSSSSTSASLSATGESAAPIVPKQETLDMLDRWTESNFKNGSPIQKIMKTRLRNAVLTVVREGVLGPSAGAGAGASASASASANANSGSGSNDGGSSSPSSAAGTGLEPLMPEIQHLGERMTKLVQFHSRVYRGLYEADGFLEW